jgi:hypothetical protein
MHSWITKFEEELCTSSSYNVSVGELEGLIVGSELLELGELSLVVEGDVSEFLLDVSGAYSLSAELEKVMQSSSMSVPVSDLLIA